LAGALGGACSTSNDASASVQRASDAFGDRLNSLKLALDMSDASNSALNCTNGTLAGALGGACSTSNDASASVQRASDAFGDRLKGLKLTLQVAASDAGGDTLCSTLETRNDAIGAREGRDSGGRDHASQSQGKGESSELHYCDILGQK
jgi:ABC-type transporter Mla subunit MlaD